MPWAQGYGSAFLNSGSDPTVEPQQSHNVLQAGAIRQVQGHRGYWHFGVYWRTRFNVQKQVVMANKAKKAAPVANREHLEQHVAAFLKSGGKVQKIPSGVSGQTSTSGPRQIVLSHKTSS